MELFIFGRFHARPEHENAVEEALLTVLEKAQTQVEPEEIEAEIYSRPERFILNYKILSERWVGDGGEEEAGAVEEGYVFDEDEPGTYRLLIEARVDASALKGALGQLAAGSRDVFINLVILDVTDYGTYDSIKAALERIPVIEDISYGSFFRGRVVLRVKTPVTSEVLSKEISGATGDGFAISPGGPDIIIMKALQPGKPSIRR